MTESGAAPEDGAAPEGGATPEGEQVPQNQRVPYGFAGTTPARSWAVFLAVVVVIGVLILLVVLAIDLPTCEHPPNSWAPCIGP